MYYWEFDARSAFAVFGIIDYLKVSRDLQTRRRSIHDRPNVITEHVSQRRISNFPQSQGREDPGRRNEVVRVEKDDIFRRRLIYTARGKTSPRRGSAELNSNAEYTSPKVSKTGYKLKWVTSHARRVHYGDVIAVRLTNRWSERRHMMTRSDYGRRRQEHGERRDLNLDSAPVRNGPTGTAPEFATTDRLFRTT